MCAKQQTEVAVKSGGQQTAVATPVADPLLKYGGNAFLESFIEGFSNLSPDRKARKNIFLSDDEYVSDRKALAERLNIWKNLLTDNKEIDKMVGVSKKEATAAGDTLQKNLKKAVDKTRDLERNYRSVALFYKNTESDKVKNITLLNASPEQMRDLDNPRFIDRISTEFKENFDRLDLRQNYSILVLPGYLGKKSVLDKWAKIAHDNKVMLVTDFQDLGAPDDVIEMYDKADLAGGDIFLSNVLITSNWLLGRPHVARAGENEDDDLFVPPSAALAGKMYATLLSQVAAGKKFGGINEVDGVRFDLKKSEISHMERIGMVPMVNEYSKVMAFSGKTLFNGDNLGLQTYSVVRVFDHVTKVLFDFLNRRAFENWTTRTEKDLRSQIVKYLDSITGPKSLIEKFKVLHIEQDPNQKDQINIDIHLKPYFPAKSFVIELHGRKGEDEIVDWDSKYTQE
jgi:hypothetical protein